MGQDHLLEVGTICADDKIPKHQRAALRCAASKRKSLEWIYAVLSSVTALRLYLSVDAGIGGLISFQQAADYSHLRRIRVQRVCLDKETHFENTILKHI